MWGFTDAGRDKLVDFLASALRPLAAAVAIAVSAALFEAVRPAPNVGGHWYCLTRTDHDVPRDRYAGMLILYDTFLQVDGEAIAGYDEMFAEYSSGRKEILDDRVVNELSGTVHRKYFFANSRVSIGVRNEGRNDLRESIRSYDMIIRGNRMSGEFHSSVGNQRGRVVCQRELFDDLKGEPDETEQRLQSEFSH